MALVTKAGRELLRNTISSVGHHNRVLEEQGMWRQFEMERGLTMMVSDDSIRKRYRSKRESKPDPLSVVRRKRKKHGSMEEARWDHSGYRELYPEEAAQRTERSTSRESNAKRYSRHDRSRSRSHRSLSSTRKRSRTRSRSSGRSRSSKHDRAKRDKKADQNCSKRHHEDAKERSRRVDSRASSSRNTNKYRDDCRDSGRYKSRRDEAKPVLRHSSTSSVSGSDRRRRRRSTSSRSKLRSDGHHRRSTTSPHGRRHGSKSRRERSRSASRNRIRTNAYSHRRQDVVRPKDNRSNDRRLKHRRSDDQRLTDRERGHDRMNSGRNGNSARRSGNTRVYDKNADHYNQSVSDSKMRRKKSKRNRRIRPSVGNNGVRRNTDSRLTNGRVRAGQRGDGVLRSVVKHQARVARNARRPESPRGVCYGDYLNRAEDENARVVRPLALQFRKDQPSRPERSAVSPVFSPVFSPVTDKSATSSSSSSGSCVGSSSSSSSCFSGSECSGSEFSSSEDEHSAEEQKITSEA